MAAATVARQPAAAATSMMARVERLDLLLGYLEEMHGNGNGNASPAHSATTASSPSTPAAAGGGRGGHLLGLVSSDDDDSSAASTPRGTSKTWRRRHPRPAKEVLEEARAKGSLIDRIASLEHRVLKMEEGMELEITPADTEKGSHQPSAMMSKDDPSSRKTKTKKNMGLKSLVKSCVRGNLKTKD